MIEFFKFESILFCDPDTQDRGTMIKGSNKYKVLSTFELALLKNTLFIVVCAKVYSQSIVLLTRSLMNYQADIYVYIGGPNEYLDFNGNRLSYGNSLLLNNNIKNIYSEISIPLYKYFNEIILEQKSANKFLVNYNKTICLKDFIGEYTNHFLGKRITLYQPQDYDNIIHIIGDSRTYGYGVEDKFTFPSLLQQQLNNKNYKIKVVNYGMCGYLLEGLLNRISCINFSHKDIVLICLSFNLGLMNF